MTRPDRSRRERGADALLPGFPGGRPGQWAILIGLFVLVMVDEVAFHGILFHSGWWRVALGIITATGLLLSVAARLRPPQ